MSSIENLSLESISVIVLSLGSKYWAFELSEGWRKGSKQLADTYPRSIADFGLSVDRKITTAFSDSTKIYFVSTDLVHVFHVSDIDSKV
jgi:hypothetical protein